jgi:polar amino acid transport system substrate-binding protein
MRTHRLLASCALLALLAVAAAGCGSSKKSSAAVSKGCGKADLQLVNSGMLTIGTDNPAYPPWFGGTPAKGSMWKISDPASGQGFEGAVAKAVADKLGFASNEVKWVVVPFDQSFKPGAKSFDIDINQVSYSAQRAKNVDFSDSYYDVNQALVAIKGTPITKVKSIADLKSHKLGVQVGTTSFDYVDQNIKPDQQPSVYNNSNDVNSGLKSHGVEGIVTDLPTAYYITGAEQVPNSVIVGQFPSVGTQEHFGLVLAKDSGLTACVNKALADLRAAGTLAKIQNEWLSQKTSVPSLGPSPTVN